MTDLIKSTPLRTARAWPELKSSKNSKNSKNSIYIQSRSDPSGGGGLPSPSGRYRRPPSIFWHARLACSGRAS